MSLLVAAHVLSVSLFRSLTLLRFVSSCPAVAYIRVLDPSNIYLCVSVSQAKRRQMKTKGQEYMDRVCTTPHTPSPFPPASSLFALFSAPTFSLFLSACLSLPISHFFSPLSLSLSLCLSWVAAWSTAIFVICSYIYTHTHIHVNTNIPTYGRVHTVNTYACKYSRDNVRRRKFVFNKPSA